jgi:glycosyltransferase A (GT-A) superfamily protein (DUF2064 family)
VKHALVILTKVPATGKVKTRLTIEQGGVFTPEQARSFYEACLLDVLDACIMVDNCRLWICHDQAGDREHLNLLITRLRKGNRIAGVFKDRGGSYIESIQYAADFLLKPGKKEKLAESVIILGGDIPGLQPYALKEAIYKLEALSQSEAGQKAAVCLDDQHRQIGAALVASAGYDCGINILGYTCNTPFNYNKILNHGDELIVSDILDQSSRIAGTPVAVLETIQGVKTATDFINIIPKLKIMQKAAQYDSSIVAPQHTLAFIEEYKLGSYLCQELN